MNRQLLLVALSAFAWSCSNKSDPAADKANFTRIYDNNKFEASYFPIDITQTPDGGYLILGGRRLDNSNFSGVYLMKVDELGAFVSEKEVDSNNIDPIGPILTANGKYYFFCMSSVALQSQLIEMDANGEITQTINVGGTYPAAAAADNGSFLLLSYDNVNKQSVISLVSPTGSVSGSKGFSIGQGDAVEAPIINHFIRNGRQFPFQVGKALSGQYFFNGFFNYTFSLVFTDLTSAAPLGVVQGQQTEGGLSQVLPLTGTTYATARFSFGDNYFIPAAALNSSGISSSVDLGGNSFPELTANAPVKILLTTINAREIILYGSNTHSKQIALYGYNKTSGEFLGSKYIGFSNPFEIAGMTTTADGGLAVCGTTYVAGRFRRICLFKFSREELGKVFK
jgi:hypothetical protein